MRKKLTVDDLERLESFPLYGIQKLTKLGGSYAIILPKAWVEFNAYEIEGVNRKGELEYTYWVEVAVEDGSIIRIRPLDVEECLTNLSYIKEKPKK